MPVKFWQAGQASSGTTITTYLTRGLAFILSRDCAAGVVSHVSADRSFNRNDGFDVDCSGFWLDTSLTPGNQIFSDSTR